MKRVPDWKRVLFALLLAMICLIAGSPVYAGGPRWIAGSSYFNASVEGQPVVWAGACLTGGSGCAQFNVVAVHTQTAQLVAESGTSQTIAATESFAPVVLEVTDAIGHPMAGAVVTFYETLDEWTPECPAHGACPPAPVLGQASSQATSGADGTVTLTPLSIAGEPSRLLVTAVAGASATLNFELDKHP